MHFVLIRKDAVRVNFSHVNSYKPVYLDGVYRGVGLTFSNGAYLVIDADIEEVDAALQGIDHVDS